MAGDLTRPAVAARELLRVAARPMDLRGRVVVDVVGVVDDCTAPLLDSCLRTHAGRRGLRKLVAHVAQVTVLGAAGLAALAEAAELCRARGARLVVLGGGRSAVRRPVRTRRQVAAGADRTPEPQASPDPRPSLSPRRPVRGSPSGAPPSRGCASAEGPARRPCGGARPDAGR
jgi:anti-anti-sigma factor